MFVLNTINGHGIAFNKNFTAVRPNVFETFVIVFCFMSFNLMQCYNIA